MLLAQRSSTRPRPQEIVLARAIVFAPPDWRSIPIALKMPEKGE